MRAIRDIFRPRLRCSAWSASSTAESALAKTLSGGQRQRFSIATALVNDPSVVFLDEPTSGLDPQARRRLWDIVRSLRGRERTVVLTTHYIEEAEALCDQVGILDEGRLIALDSPRNLVRALLDRGFKREG